MIEASCLPALTEHGVVWYGAHGVHTAVASPVLSGTPIVRADTSGLDCEGKHKPKMG